MTFDFTLSKNNLKITATITGRNNPSTGSAVDQAGGETPPVIVGDQDPSDPNKITFTVPAAGTYDVTITCGVDIKTKSITVP